MSNVCDACRENQYESCTHVRTGKTKKDHESGAWGNRFGNRELRTSWMKSSNASNATFPRHACNGKKNRLHM